MSRVLTLTALLIVIIGAMAILYTENYGENNYKDKKKSHMEDDYLEIEGTKYIKNNNVIVSDRFTGKIQEDANVVVLGKNGQIVDIHKGIVLTDEMVIEVREEGVTVLSLDNMRVISN